MNRISRRAGQALPFCCSLFIAFLPWSSDMALADAAPPGRSASEENRPAEAESATIDAMPAPRTAAGENSRSGSAPTEVAFTQDDLNLDDYLARGEFEKAEQLAGSIIDQLKDADDIDALELVDPYLKLATAQIAQREYGLAKSQIDQVLQLMETEGGVYEPLLVDPLIIKGEILYLMGENEEAEGLLRRAQHIVHRNEGVYSPNQLPILDRITILEDQRGNHMMADQQQDFSLRVQEQTFGEDTPELLEGLWRIARYKQNRYRFDQALQLHDRAIAIVEEHFGPNDMQLLRHLKAAAEITIDQGRNRTRGIKALERGLDIVMTNPNATVEDQVRTLVDLADVMLIGNRGDYITYYQQAWDLIEANPDLRPLRDEYFGTPTRLYPPFTTHSISAFPSLEELEEDPYIDVEFTIRANGHVSDVEVASANVPNENRRTFKQQVYHYRFRPRFSKRDPVDTPGMLIHEVLAVEEAPEPTASFRVGTSRFADPP